MIGSLKHKMCLQQGRSTPMEGGGYQEEFIDIKEIMAHIKPFRGKELMIAMGSRAQISHNIQIRYDSIVQPQMRLVYKKRIFKIQIVMNVKEEDRFLSLYCLEEWEKHDQ